MDYIILEKLLCIKRPYQCVRKKRISNTTLHSILINSYYKPICSVHNKLREPCAKKLKQNLTGPFTKMYIS